VAGGDPADLDLLDLDDDQWSSAQGDEHLSAALQAVLGPGRGMGVATKILHLKRPRLFPVLDSLVAQMFGVNAPPDATLPRRIETALELARAIRREGRNNVNVLRCIKQTLQDADGIDRPLARILDALVWFSHPAAGVAGAKRAIEVRLDPD
jgi:hypothetical protein